MPGPRHPVTMLGAAAALIASLVACASTVEGTAAYGGADPTTETTTQTTETTTETTESTTETTESTGSEAEETACFLIPLSDVDAFDAFNELAAQPEADQTQAMRDNVAALFDAAQMEVQTYIDPLPEGPVKEGAVATQVAQVEVRDRLRAGSDVNTQIIVDANDVLAAACDG
ncbi:MAG: hypothetical protein H0T66_05280 [Geodermatophilaceae bacterium]|nr:hypothetical protein [Geodermatophilaceae bacterium]